MKRNVFAIIGSASLNSSNLKLVKYVAHETTNDFDFTIFDRLSELPHFNPELSVEATPLTIQNFRMAVDAADAVLICTPEYIFSLPSGLKNAIEWCVSTTIFSGKPVGLITASANGRKAHEELMLIMKTVDANFDDDTTLLVQGVKGKIDEQGTITDAATGEQLARFIAGFSRLVAEAAGNRC